MNIGTKEWDEYINTPSQKLVDNAYNNCSADADTVNADTGEDEDEEHYLGEVAMAETAQDFAFWFEVLDRCMKADFLPREWRLRRRKHAHPRRTRQAR